MSTYSGIVNTMGHHPLTGVYDLRNRKCLAITSVLGTKARHVRHLMSYRLMRATNDTDLSASVAVTYRKQVALKPWAKHISVSICSTIGLF